MKKEKFFLGLCSIGLLFSAFIPLAASASSPDDLPVVIQEMVKPPFLPKHSIVAKGGPKVIKVELTVTEKIISIDKQGTKFRVFGFNDSVPGPIIVAHVGDYIELTLKNPYENNFLHNVDFHAATGALGGGALTLVRPGEKVTIRWKAIKPGVFVYHCAPRSYGALACS